MFRTRYFRKDIQTAGDGLDDSTIYETPEVAVTICDDDGGDCIFGDGFESGDTSAWLGTP